SVLHYQQQLPPPPQQHRLQPPPRQLRQQQNRQPAQLRQRVSVGCGVMTNCTNYQTNQQTILQLTNMNFQSSYTTYTFSYITSANLTMITFSFRNDPQYWVLDDVKFVDTVTSNNQVTNGGFESGSLYPWTYCNPGNATFAGGIDDTLRNHGTYDYADGSVGSADYLSQSVSTVVNRTYTVSFALANILGTTGGATPTRMAPSVALVTVSP
ncbi:unnamed protein product, partial [Didymodactylos carnosus]